MINHITVTSALGSRVTTRFLPELDALESFFNQRLIVNSISPPFSLCLIVVDLGGSKEENFAFEKKVTEIDCDIKKIFSVGFYYEHYSDPKQDPNYKRKISTGFAEKLNMFSIDFQITKVENRLLHSIIEIINPDFW